MLQGSNQGNTAMLKLVTPSSTKSILDEIIREGAQKILINALEQEISGYVDAHKNLLDENGHRLVVRNGQGKERSVVLPVGEVSLRVPRVNDRREGHQFTSKILPPYLRKSPNLESLIPVLYLKGLSTSDFSDALASILGEGVKGLSPASIVELKKSWELEHEAWAKRAFTKQYAYIWADGVHVKVRLGEDKSICLLVIIGVAISGKKELLAVEAGYRESKDSWKSVLNNLSARGMKAPLVAVGDGALGFWGALRESDGYAKVKEQRCWVHKIVNVLDCFPKRLQGEVKSLLHDMMYANKKSDAEEVKKIFEKNFQEKYPKGTEKLHKDWEELTTFFSFPGAHWKNLRTTNPIESAFATVRLRTKITKGAGSSKTAKAMTFKLLQEAEKRWHSLPHAELFADLLNGVEYVDGVVLHKPSQEVHAATG